MSPRCKALRLAGMSAKTNAARASHPSRIVRGLPSLLFPLCGERLEVRQRSSGGVPLLPELVADHDFHHRSASTAGTSGLILFQDRMRRRPQCPNNQHALTRGLECPRPIHSRESSACHWLCRNRPASSRSHVFTADTLRQAGVVRNRKTSSACAETVNYADYLWKATEKIG